MTVIDPSSIGRKPAPRTVGRNYQSLFLMLFVTVLLFFCLREGSQFRDEAFRGYKNIRIDNKLSKNFFKSCSTEIINEYDSDFLSRAYSHAP
jgi:hypothetical protein